MHSDDNIVPLSKLKLTTRAYNALVRTGINTIQDLLSFPQEDIFRIRNIGQKTLDEIFFVIEELNSGDVLICSENNIKETQQIKSFIGFDGQRYNDISIEDLGLSVRAFNCLKSAKINYYSELILKSDVELIDIVNIGKKSLLEIEQIKNNTVPTLFCNGEDNKYVTAEYICSNVFALINEKFNVNSINLFEKLLPVCSMYIEGKEDIIDVSECLEDKYFFKSIFDLKYIQDIFKEYILNVIKENIYGCDENYVLENMPRSFNNINFVNRLLKDLYNSNKIELFNNDKYIVTYPSFVIGAQEILSEKEYKVFLQRTEGKTLEQIGQDSDVSRERIRQIEANATRKLNERSAIFKEDIYLEIFKKYAINSEDFVIAFKSIQTYNYLSLRYSSSKGRNKDTKLPMEQILEDKQIPVIFKRALEKSIYKNYVKIGSEYIPCTRADICNFVLKTFATDGITFEEFSELYMAVLEDIDKRDDPKLSLMDRGYENKLAASNSVLWKYGKKFRYYNMEQYDFTELLETINLNQYSNVEYSTLKFFRLYPEIMKSYDIRDEYELHNLLKKICSKDIYSSVLFKRMPNIEFGEADRDNQVMELLLALAPISNDNFAKQYENEYGVAASTVLANYMKNFEQYFYNGIYKIDFPLLPNIISQKLKKLLVDDFYLLSTIRTIYSTEFSNLDDNLLNPFSLKNLGFKVYSHYAIKDNYNSATDYFYYLLTKDDVTYVDSFPPEVKGIIAYTAELYKLKSEYEIIEFLPNKYVNFRKLQQFGITKEMLKKYCEDVLNFIGESRYFTLKTLREEDFYHELDEIGFEDWFYTSILVEDKNNLSYLRVGGNKLMLSGKFNVVLEEFLESIVYSQESLSIDIYELLNFLNSYYDISINIWRLIETIKNSSMFYDTVSEKVYADYNVYYEEI